MNPPRLLVLVIACCAALSGGCGAGEEQEGGAPDEEKPTVVATTGFAADLVRAVAGEDTEVVQLVPDAANPHSYAASAQDRAKLDGADLVVAFGRNYEEGLPLDEVRAPRLEIAGHVGELRRFSAGEVADERGREDEDDDHGHDDGHRDEDDGHAPGPGSRDPHVWMDPTRLAAAAPAIADALAKAEPAKADAFRTRARDHAERLRALDAELREILARVPQERRKLVTSHESMGYFADRYDLRVVGAPFGLAPEAQASSRDVAEVIAEVRAEQVPVVFAQQGDDPKVMRRIADEAGVRIVDDLHVENPGPGADTYADAMRHNARRVAEALAR
jgi:zinc/manganese transport system substrate-binding protein